MKQTKIVASISDRRCDQDFIRSLFEAGMNVVRMNTAHADEQGIKNIINNVRSVSHHIGILIDTKGPEVRTTGCPEPIAYKTGDVVKIFGRPEMDTTHDIINLSYADFAADVHEGCHILFDDGALAYFRNFQYLFGTEVYADAAAFTTFCNQFQHSKTLL